VMMSRHPVVVTKMLALGAASSMVVTSYPAAKSLHDQMIFKKPWKPIEIHP
jgi:hypothetical protein